MTVDTITRYLKAIGVLTGDIVSMQIYPDGSGHIADDFGDTFAEWDDISSFHEAISNFFADEILNDSQAG